MTAEEQWPFQGLVPSFRPWCAVRGDPDCDRRRRDHLTIARRSVSPSPRQRRRGRRVAHRRLRAKPNLAPVNAPHREVHHVGIAEQVIRVVHESTQAIADAKRAGDQLAAVDKKTNDAAIKGAQEVATAKRRAVQDSGDADVKATQKAAAEGKRAGSRACHKSKRPAASANGRGKRA